MRKQKGSRQRRLDLLSGRTGAYNAGMSIRRAAVGCWLCLAGLAPAAEPPRYTPLAPRDAQWYGSTFWTGPDWARVGRDWHHPGLHNATVRRLVAPAGGRVTVTGRAYKLDTNGGDGVRLIVRHNAREVWTAEIGAKDVAGVDPNITLDVRKGDAIRFVVDRKGTYSYDTTHWDPAVTYAGGKRYLASEGFSPAEQGANGWWYEMEGTGQVPKASPVARGRGGRAASARPRAEFVPVRGDLNAMVEHEWHWEDRLDAGAPAGALAAAAKSHAAKARQLLADLRDPGRHVRQLAGLEAKLGRLGDDKAEAEELYLAVRRLKRDIALANPLLDFAELLFCKRVPGRYSHQVGQYYGFYARPGGGLFVLEAPGRSLKARDVLDGKLAGGSVMEPRLSYDAKRVVFARVQCSGKKHDINKLDNESVDEDFHHIYEVNIDGTGLRQLTAGPYDDLMPTYLPCGDIVFSSTRRQGHGRCFHPRFGTRWQVYTLYRVDANGAYVRPVSRHDTNEWHPAVGNDGMLLYARWDYIDRDAVTHQNLWATRPDGANPFALWGNAVLDPHCTFQPQPIPHSDKIVFTASAHHAHTGGSLVVVDPSVSNNDHAAIRRITPHVPFPEAEGRPQEYYASPWPLSEKYFLCSYSPWPLTFEVGPERPNGLGLYLLDVFGNRELLYRDPDIGCETPIPLRARTRPPILPDVAPGATAPAAPAGQMLMLDVYRGLEPAVPRGAVKRIRIVQIFPKTTPYGNSPAIGAAREENARAILGTVGVEADGSAYFTLPAATPVLFQALDANGFAVQTMRSLTYVQAGERTSCIGCHEHRRTAPPNGPPLAVRRPPSDIDPGHWGGRAWSFVRAVQPVLDKHCVTCHGGGTRPPPKGIDLRATPVAAGGGTTFTRSYVSLTAGDLVPRFAMRNRIEVTPPGGSMGSPGSRLMRMLLAGHPGKADPAGLGRKVKLSREELARLAAWIDMNITFFGTYSPQEQARQLRGEDLPMPEIQ